MKNSISNWIREKARSKYAEWWLSGLSFADSSISPLPPDPLLVGLSYLESNKWQRLALITFLASIAGGLFGYWLGDAFSAEITNFLVNTYDLGHELEIVAMQFQRNAFFSLFIAAFTPIPFKVFTVSAGLFSINLVTFLAASIIGRGLRFYIVSFLAAKFGSVGVQKFKVILSWLTAILIIVLIIVWFK